MDDNKQTNISKKLAKVFDLPKGELIVHDSIQEIPKNDTTQANVEYDYEQARNNIHSLLQQGSDALIYALEIAKSTENPRAFEVFNQILQTMSDMNLQLIETSEKFKKISSTQDKNASTPENPITNNTAIFVGNNYELNKLVKSMIKGNNDTSSTE
jgi:hypothetical protein